MRFQYLKMLSLGLSFIFVFYSLAWMIYRESAVFPVMNTPQDVGHVFVIDAGHGGGDGGASSDGGILEKNINLQISLRMSAVLKTLGIPHVLTRSEDVMLDCEPSTAGRKMRDLKGRIQTAQKYPNCTFVSIHQNKFPQKKYSGLQVYYSKNHPSSSVVANSIQSAVRLYLQSDNTRQTKQATSAIYVLDRLQCPAVLVECGFLSNDNEARLLVSEEYQKKLSAVLCAALVGCKE